MGMVQIDDDEPLLKMGMKPAALLFLSPEGTIAIRWFEGCSPEEIRRVEDLLARGVRFEDLL